MVEYIKSVLVLLFAGALLVVFLITGFAILAAIAIILPIIYLWYRWKINRKLDEIRTQRANFDNEIIEVEYEIVDEENSESTKD